ncbi:MAG TPA: outer membrane protein assembly factor BamD [Pyrinomonadaceae bacterium]|jgi:outer membrane protein assembly factor BamD (BamD/ComL family)|nr:outer membrane protein assembly factor BamD [Pyrinomonadaceae bacterium]
MKKITLAFCGLALMLCCAAASPARAQGGGVAKGPDPSVVKDPELEKEMKHNLEVARHYFKMKKAYRAAITRCEEIIAGYPQFSRLDEALYIAGMSSLYLSENRGKQKADIPADKLREDARTYLSQLVSEFPDSDFRKDAEDTLRPLGGAKPKEETRQ